MKYVDPDGESGELTIYSVGGSLLGGHAWISYTPDDTGITTTYGTWGNNPTGHGNGLFENLEKNFPTEVTRSTHLNDKQEQSLFNTINKYKDKGEDAWNLLGPCSKFAQDAWDSATGEYLEANTFITINNPETLKKSIIEANGNNTNGFLEKQNNSFEENSFNRSSGSFSYGIGNISNVSLDPIYDLLIEN